MHKMFGDQTSQRKLKWDVFSLAEALTSQIRTLGKSLTHLCPDISKVRTTWRRKFVQF